MHAQLAAFALESRPQPRRAAAASLRSACYAPGREEEEGSRIMKRNQETRSSRGCKGERGGCGRDRRARACVRVRSCFLRACACVIGGGGGCHVARVVFVEVLFVALLLGIVGLVVVVELVVLVLALVLVLVVVLVLVIGGGGGGGGGVGGVGALKRSAKKGAKAVSEASPFEWRSIGGARTVGSFKCKLLSEIVPNRKWSSTESSPTLSPPPCGRAWRPRPAGARRRRLSAVRGGSTLSRWSWSPKSSRLRNSLCHAIPQPREDSRLTPSTPCNDRRRRQCGEYSDAVSGCGGNEDGMASDATLQCTN